MLLYQRHLAAGTNLVGDQKTIMKNSDSTILEQGIIMGRRR